MEIEKVNFKDIINSELKDIINEHLVNNGIIAIDYNPNLRLLDFTFGQKYTFMYAVDIDIYFIKTDDDSQFPIKISYETTYSYQQINFIDFITEELYNKRFKV